MNILSVKKLIKSFLPEPVLSVLRKRKEIPYRIDMLLFSRKMRYFCPCCGLKFRRFVSGNYINNPNTYNPVRYAHIRQEVHCPVCHSMPRHRILATWCEKHKDILLSSEILYFAPEQSMMRWMKRNGVSLKTADLYHEVDLCLDIQATGLPDASYDIVFCNHVLEHVDDFRIALHEMLRILRPGGLFICSFPMDPKVDVIDEDARVRTDEERLKRFGQKDHKRVFGMRAEQLLIEAGFRSVEKISGKSCPDNILPVVGPADYDINLLFCCTK